MDKTFADTKAANAEMTRQNSELEKRKSELVKENSSLAATNTALSDEKKRLDADRKKVADEIADIKADKSKLIEERSACAKETEAARKEKETALQEAAEAKAQRDSNRKDALSNLANRFTGARPRDLNPNSPKAARKSGRSRSEPMKPPRPTAAVYGICNSSSTGRKSSITASSEDIRKLKTLYNDSFRCHCCPASH